MKINSMFYLIALCSCFAGCGPKGDYKELRGEVIKLHDEVMAKNDEVVHQQMKLDTLLRNLDSLKKQTSSLDTNQVRHDLSGLLKDLQNAEEKMNDWMHSFEPDVEGKSNDDAAAYFNEEKKKLNQIDSLYNTKTKETADYLKKLKKR